jgi:hypothetical protein
MIITIDILGALSDDKALILFSTISLGDSGFSLIYFPRPVFLHRHLLLETQAIQTYPAGRISLPAHLR